VADRADLRHPPIEAGSVTSARAPANGGVTDYGSPSVTPSNGRYRNSRRVGVATAVFDFVDGAVATTRRRTYR
jgi:hypothetical protein